DRPFHALKGAKAGDAKLQESAPADATVAMPIAMTWACKTTQSRFSLGRLGNRVANVCDYNFARSSETQRRERPPPLSSGATSRCLGRATRHLVTRSQQRRYIGRVGHDENVARSNERQHYLVWRRLTMSLWKALVTLCPCWTASFG